MDYLIFLRRDADVLTSRFLVASLLASAANGILIATIISSGDTGPGTPGALRSFLLFILSFLLYLATRKYMLDRTSDSVESVVRKIRLQICDGLRNAELASFEAISKPMIQQALAQDCQTLYDAALDVMLAIAAIGVALSAFVYIALISFNAFVMIALVLTLGVFAYASNQKAVRQEYEQAAAEEQRFFQFLSDQLDGFKELRINQDKAEDLLKNDILASARRTEQIKVKIGRKLNTNAVLGQAFLYALLGGIIFVLPGFVEGNNVPIAKIAAVMLFLTGPLGDLAGATPVFFRANVATKRIWKLKAMLSTLKPDTSIALERATGFETLRCEKLVFRYPPQPGRMNDDFQVGPLDLEIRRGEIIFLVGGNGSGKSTLLNLLCGLYSSTDGRIVVNDQPVSSVNLPWLRSFFSIILQDFHLFRRLLGHPRIDEARVAHLLQMLRMRGITNVDEKGIISNLNLSTGQKKRLALLVAECDDRDVFVFDEWAADQDPDFRRYFYEVYLLELRARGKTIIAATHDDHFFHIADRVLRMDRGQLSVFERVALARPPEAPPAALT